VKRRRLRRKNSEKRRLRRIWRGEEGLEEYGEEKKA
jgi:hypothetical protein